MKQPILYLGALAMLLLAQFPTVSSAKQSRLFQESTAQHIICFDAGGWSYGGGGGDSSRYNYNYQEYKNQSTYSYNMQGNSGNTGGEEKETSSYYWWWWGGHDDGGGNDIPLDGGLSFLVAAGAGLGAKKLADKKKAAKK